MSENNNGICVHLLQVVRIPKTNEASPASATKGDDHRRACTLLEVVGTVTTQPIQYLVLLMLCFPLFSPIAILATPGV